MSQFIHVIEKALSASFCDDLVAKFETDPNKHQGRTGGGVDLDKKRSVDLTISQHGHYQQELQHIATVTANHLINYLLEHKAALVGPLGLQIPHPKTSEPTTLTVENFDEIGAPSIEGLMKSVFGLGAINIQKYMKQQGGYPHWHSETFPQIGNNDALHRILLFMYYLNDVEEGGETEFLYQQKKVKPVKGTMVIAPAYFTHTHRGNVPISDDKYIVTSWVLFNRAERLYGQQ